MLWPNGNKQRPQTTSPFGMRWHPIQNVWKLHAGSDLIGFMTVHAIAAGRVVAVGTPAGWSGGGVQVWIQHAGFLSRSMHLARHSPLVRVGDLVAEGQALATMGMTGGATGIHLHLEVVVDGRQIDPVPFIGDRIASPAGGSSSPAPSPAPNPVPTLEDLMASGGFYYSPTKNHIVYLIIDTESGVYHEYSNGPGKGAMPSAYNNAIAAAFKTGNFASITPGHAAVIKRALAAVQPKAPATSLDVQLDWADVDVVKTLLKAQGEDVAATAEAIANGALAGA